MNIDLLCGHSTMMDCGCTKCARAEALEEAARVADDCLVSGCHCSLVADAIRAIAGKKKS